MKMTTMKELTKKLNSLRSNVGRNDCFVMTRKLECHDGTMMSIQASEAHYCQPRKTLGSFDGYTEVEIGFPTREIECIKKFAECDENYTDTVYPYVPMDVVLDAVNECGGIAL